MIRRLLIANRGEIARRIARTCRRLGIDVVGVYSEADAASAHLQGTVARACLGPAAAAESYLNQARIIDVALEHHCEAIHPGYGFLSENAAFAAAVGRAGLIFVGPDPETIEAFGDKAHAKDLMRTAGLNTVPGSAQASDDLRLLQKMADKVGYPALLKPSAGGGGKGMQIVGTRPEMKEAVERAVRLAKANFGDGRLIIERYLPQARHIEVQVFGDAYGNVVHLFERDCSLQRRHQKVIEETPAPALSEELRLALVEAAVHGAKAVGYKNAGTCEFIVTAEGEYYFLEANTRLQVEHPVTEAITGIDLVEWQLRVASGERLPLSQNEIVCRGHAIECRIYAEDAASGFRVAPGRASHVSWPGNMRVESAFEDHGEVPPFYDPMVGKLIAHAESRTQALLNMREGLKSTVLLGLTTNLGFLRKILSDPKVEAAQLYSSYLDEEVARLGVTEGPAAAVACACAVDLECGRSTAPRWPWSACYPTGVFDRVYLEPHASLGECRYWHGHESYKGAIAEWDESEGRIAVGNDEFEVRIEDKGPEIWRGRVGDRTWYAAPAPGGFELTVDGTRYSLEAYGNRNLSEFAVGASAVSPMPGIVVAIPVKIGQVIREGDVLAIVEAMKMENKVVAAFDGRVKAINCSMKQNVNAGDVLVTVEPMT